MDLHLGVSDQSGSIGYQFNVAEESQVFSLGFNAHGLCGFCSGDSSELYFTYGRRKPWRFFNTIVQAGVSVVEEQETGEPTFGIPVSLRLVTGKYLGAGLGLYFNINKDNPIGILSLIVLLGKFN